MVSPCTITRAAPSRTALAGAMGGPLAPAAEFILGAMSKRMADQLREEIANVGKVKPKEAEEAMGTIVSTIRELEAAGEVLLLAGDDD